MSGVEDIVRAELHRLGAVDATPDWHEVAARAGVKRDKRLRWAAAVTLAGAAIVVAVATPLGAAIVDELGGFSAWLTGQPGSPVSPREQRAFDAANARWGGFPAGTQLRRLTTRRIEGATVELLGFRSGASALCLRLIVDGKTRTSALGCAPLEELRQAGAPARVVMIDHPIGKGDKVGWYGVDRVRSANVQITTGIAADGVRSLVLVDEAGRHEVGAVSNAFLYVAEHPQVGQRVRRIWARTAKGLVPVPFAPAPLPSRFGGGGSRRAAPPAPRIERKVNGGRIGWLERGEPRGQTLDVLPPSVRANLIDWRPRSMLSGRVLAPDPDRPVRLVVALNAGRLCTMWVRQGNTETAGCTPYPRVFAHTLIDAGMSGGSSDEFMPVQGVVSDDVARLELELVDGQPMHVPLRDNGFLADAPRAKLPAYLVGYDRAGHVISVSGPWSDLAGPGPTRGRPKRVLRASGGYGATSEVLVGRSTSGGECMYIRFDDGRGGVLTSCSGRRWSGAPLQLSTDSSPSWFVAGRVRPDVKVVRIRFANNAYADVRPTRGYILYAVPLKYIEPGRGPVAAAGLRADRSVIARMSFPGPP